jgi:hypothetical protein
VRAAPNGYTTGQPGGAPRTARATTLARQEAGLSTTLRTDTRPSLSQRLHAVDWLTWSVRARWLLIAVIVLAFIGACLTGHAQASVPAAVGIVVAWFVVRALFSGVERELISVVMLAAFAVRVVASLILHPLLVTNVKRGDGRIDVFVGFLFEDDRAFDVVSWALARLWSGALEQTA